MASVFVKLEELNKKIEGDSGERCWKILLAPTGYTNWKIYEKNKMNRIIQEINFYGIRAEINKKKTNFRQSPTILQVSILQNLVSRQTTNIWYISKSPQY